MRKKVVLAIIIVAIFFSVVVGHRIYLRYSAKKREISINNGEGENVELFVEIPDTSEEFNKGLMHRESLGENKGMLSVFQESGYQSFWMKNTEIPLSIAFIDENGVIVGIREMHPHSENVREPSEPCIYALEVNRGFFENHKIRVGNRVFLSNP